MTNYLLKKFKGDGAPAGHGEFEGESDEEVLAWVKRLPRSFRYELWRAERQLFSANAHDAPPTQATEAWRERSSDPLATIEQDRRNA